MVQPWTPELRLQETDAGCRLILVGVTAGEGPSLQMAADDLVVQLTRLAHHLRSRGLRFPAGVGPLDGRMLAFLWDISERVARGDDIRARALGFVSPELDPTV